MGIAMEHWATSDLLLISQKENHLLPDLDCPQGPEILQSETVARGQEELLC